MNDFTEYEIKTYYKKRVNGLRDTKTDFRAACPIHGGVGENNFSVNPKNGLWHCHSECGRGGDMFSLEMEMHGMDFPTAKASLFDIIGRPKPSWDDRDVIATYNYTDEKGTLLYQAVRKFGKKFAQRRPDGLGGWIWNLAGVTLVPYRLKTLIEASFVVAVEGEKDADNLTQLGVPATCNNGGAEHFSPSLAIWFTGKKVAIISDNDEVGRKHALSVAKILSPVTSSIKIIQLPDLPPKGDVSDWIYAGGTKDQLRDLYTAASEWSEDWKFEEAKPPEDEKYIHTFSREIEIAGGLEQFWDLPKQEGLVTPYPRLTRALGGGLRNGEVYIIGGNQGSGKTSLGLQFAIEVMRKDMGVLFFSMEMGARDVFQRMASIEARVDLLEFRNLQKESTFSINLKDLKSRLIEDSKFLSNMNLLVSTKSSITPEYLLEECSRLRSKMKTDLVIIDHMQLMSATGNTRGDYEKFTHISRMTKQVAKELELPVLLVSQTSRSNSADKRSELEVSDLRGSGALEEDSAAVMLLFPDHEDKKRTIENGTFSRGPVKTWLRLGKNRYGEQDKFLPLRHFKTCTRFDYASDLAEDGQVAA